MNESQQTHNQDEAQLEAIITEWKKTLPPSEFVMGTVGEGISGGTLHRYPDLHFKEDEAIPGLYVAKLDPDSIVRGNGNGTHARFHAEED